MSQQYRNLTEESILNEKSFVKATFSGGSKYWIKVVIRPVVIKGRKHVQFSYFTKKQDITKNYKGKEVIKRLQEVLRQKFKTITIETTAKTIHIETHNKGDAVIYEQMQQKQTKRIELSHDHQKSLLIPANKPLPFLQTVGIQTADGKIKADKYNKFRQINEFLKIVQQTIRDKGDKWDTGDRRDSYPFVSSVSFDPTVPLNIVDFGCGNGYLTFAVYYYFTEILKKQTHLVGVDVQGDLLKKLSREVRELGWEHIEFDENSIAHYKPQKSANIVIALHACDTATDEALAQAIKMHSNMIFVSPCCHHNLQEQLHNSPTPQLFHPIFADGILSERFGDILTDTFRGLILKIMGYQTDIMQFISYEHTTRNLMIRAVKTEQSNLQKYVHEYNALKKYWKVTPHLEMLLGKHFKEFLITNV